MKKVVWWIAGIVLSPIVLFAVLVGLLYCPPVQNWAVDKVAAIASEKTGMQISVGRVDLSFPLDLVIDDFKMIHASDTIADVSRLVADVKLLPLLHNQVVVNELEVSDTKLDTNGFIDAAQVKGHFGRLFVTSRGIDLDRQTVEANGARLEDARLDITLRDSVPEDTTTTKTLWVIHGDSLTINRSEVALHMPGDTIDVWARFGQLKACEVLADLGRPEYSVGSLDWTGGALRYNDIEMERMGLHASETVLRGDSLFVPTFRLRTADSDLFMALSMPLSFADSLSPGDMQLRVDAQLARQDLLPFMSALPAGMQAQWPQYPMSVKGQLTGNLKRMEFSGLDIELPTAFAAKADGFVANLQDTEQLQADVQFKAQTQSLGFVMAALPRDVQRNYRLPAMAAEGRVKADGAQYTADVAVREGSGTVKLQGTLNADAMRYDANQQVSNLNLHHFMPHDSLYTLTATLAANGQGTDFLSPRTTLNAEGQITHLGYGSWNLDHVDLQAQVKNGRAKATVDSRNELMAGTVGIDALVQRKRLDGTLTADVSKIDLYRLGFIANPLSIGLCGHVDMSSDLKLTHTVSGLLNDLTLRDSAKVYRPADVGLLLKARPDTTILRAQSGDFIVKMDASGPYDRLLSQCQMLGDSIAEQMAQKTIDQPAIRRLLPAMKLHVESKKENPIAAMLKSGQGIEFKDLLLDMTSSRAEGLNGKGYIHSLTVNDVLLDTIHFNVIQRSNHLSLVGQVRNNTHNPQFVFNALIDGLLQEHGATLGVRFYDAKDKLGVRLGAKAEMVDSGISFHLLPERPTIGYKEFRLNKDNYVFLGSKNRVQAKVDLIADDGTGVKIYSDNNDPTMLQDITVSLNKLNLGEITAVIPYLPRMTGLLNGDYHVVQNAEGQLSMVSDMNVSQMTYEGSPLGNLSTELVYLQKENNAHAIEVRLMKEGNDIGLFTGTYYNEGEGSLDARLQLKHTPLSLVNGFVPDQLFGLQGYGDGELTVQGPLPSPKVNGEIYLDSSYVESKPYGVTLRFDNDPVRIQDSKLLFENFTVYAYNNNPLNIQGQVDFSQLDRMMVDLRMRARDFQLIGAKENPQSIAYGKAFVNIFATMRGPVDNLTMRGRLSVLGSTDMSYVLRDSPLTTDNQLNELVKFMDFGDTAKVVVERPSLNGFQMDMTVDVSKGAHIMAYLNTDHSNYIDLMGGGTLRMQYTPADNLQLRGRYTLSNGEMKYSLPVIPLKTFTIQDGSYIEFTGDPMNPTLNITATERTKATVNDNNGSGRVAYFDCGVKITKTLNDMGLEFTLDAPEDMQLHGELQAMGVEQRGKLAVTMLTTGMYLADGNTGAFSMNSALSSFLSSEISNITGNALRTLDLSFGMDQGTDASGRTHTDYSFKFAKRFMNNRLKIAVGGLVSTGAELQKRNNSFFDNVSLEYRLDQTANKFITLYFQNNSYDWLDGYSQKYGGGFTWRRSLQSFWDIFRFKDATSTRMPAAGTTSQQRQTGTAPKGTATPADSLKTTSDEKK